ncbi:MAG TPA: winged helix-turn-helix transcriptional regulator [Candidatus Thermoplasmatota archaeon]
MAALVAGSLEALAESRLIGPSSSTAETEIVVPEGHIGDQFLYANFERKVEGTEWQEVAPYGLRLDSHQSQPDRYGTMHDVLAVTRGQTTTAQTWGSLPGENSWDSNSTHVGFVDLATGRLVGGTWDTSVHSNYRFGVQAIELDHGVVIYGPEYDPSLAFGAPGHLIDQDLFSHGRAYKVGQNLDAEALDFVDSEPILYDGVFGFFSDFYIGNVTARDGHVAGTIAQAGAINGVHALDQRFEGCVSFDPGPTWPWIPGQHEMMFLSTVVPIPSRVCFTVDRWLSEDHVVPLLVQRRLVVNGTQVRESMSTLAAHVHGTQPVEWTSSGPGFSGPLPPLDRSPASQRYPADGPSPRYGYRLADALDAIERDPSLIQYTVWKTEHPAAPLIGAKLMPTGSDLRGRAWTLIFGTPGGSGYVIRSDVDAPGALPRNVEYGEHAVTPSIAASFEPGTLALSAGQYLYDSYIAKPGSPDPNFLIWGYRFIGDIVNCQASDDCGNRTAPGVYFTTTVFGYTGTPEPPVDRARVSTEFGPWIAPPFNVIYYEPDGRLVMAWNSQRTFEYNVLPMPDSLEQPDVQASARSATPAIELRNAAILSTSIFALVLALYFAPLLKWTAGNLVMMVPGYAKLHKAALLNNKVRDTIVSAIKSEPGITAPKLQELTGTGWSTVVYHLSLLEKNKIVSSLISGRHKHFFPVDTVNWNDRAKIAVLKNLRTRELFTLIQRQPGVAAGDLARSVGIAQPSVYWHMERLEKAGLVGRDRTRFRTMFYANPLEDPRPRDPSTAMEVA